MAYLVNEFETFVVYFNGDFVYILNRARLSQIYVFTVFCI